MAQMVRYYGRHEPALGDYYLNEQPESVMPEMLLYYGRSDLVEPPLNAYYLNSRRGPINCDEDIGRGYSLYSNCDTKYLCPSCFIMAKPQPNKLDTIVATEYLPSWRINSEWISKKFFQKYKSDYARE